ncbi:MAG: hypothetical protein ACKO3G_07435 [Planctomycetaceae bacterium]
MEAVAANLFPESCHSRFTTAMLRRMDDLHERRIDILADRRELVIDLESGGRLLLVNWSESLFDGAGAVVTRGFLDDDGMPGWDTWVRIVRLDRAEGTYGLVCWVPPGLVASVDDAMRVDPARCMTWLEPDRDGVLTISGWGGSEDRGI